MYNHYLTKSPRKQWGSVCTLLCTSSFTSMCVSVSLCLTEGHPATDNLRALLHICEGGDRKTPVCYWTPEMLWRHKLLFGPLTLYGLDIYLKQVAQWNKAISVFTMCILNSKICIVNPII